MAIAIVQTVTSDCAPSNIGSIGGAGDVSGGHICVASISGFTAGNYLVALGFIPNFAGTTATKWADPVNGDWTPLEHLNCRSAPGGVTDGGDVILGYMAATATIAPGFAGKVSASGAGTATCTRFDGTAPNLSSLVGATFTEYSTGVTGTVSSVTGAGNNVLNFSGGGTAPVGNPMVVGGFIKFVVTSAGEDFPFATVVEVSGASGIFGHSSAQNVYTSTTTISTGTITAWSGTGLALSFCFDDEDNTAGPYSPSSATGTDDGTLWTASLSSPICRMQHQIVTNPGSAYGMNFTSRNSEHHQAYLAVLQQTGVVADVLLGAMDM